MARSMEPSFPAREQKSIGTQNPASVVALVTSAFDLLEDESFLQAEKAKSRSMPKAKMLRMSSIVIV